MTGIIIALFCLVLQAEKTPIAQKRKLLDILPKRGQIAFDTFCSVLIKTGHREVANKLNPQLAHSGVTAVKPEDKSTTNTTHSKSSPGVKQTQPAYPVPVQVPVDHSKNIPQPSAFGATGTKAGSQPSTPNEDRYHRTVFGTQESRDETPYDDEAEELLDNFPKPRPGITIL